MIAAALALFGALTAQLGDLCKPTVGGVQYDFSPLRGVAITGSSTDATDTSACALLVPLRWLKNIAVSHTPPRFARADIFHMCHPTSGSTCDDYDMLALKKNPLSLAKCTKLAEWISASPPQWSMSSGGSGINMRVNNGAVCPGGQGNIQIDVLFTCDATVTIPPAFKVTAVGCKYSWHIPTLLACSPSPGPAPGPAPGPVPEVEKPAFVGIILFSIGAGLVVVFYGTFISISIFFRKRRKIEHIIPFWWWTTRLPIHAAYGIAFTCCLCGKWRRQVRFRKRWMNEKMQLCCKVDDDGADEEDMSEDEDDVERQQRKARGGQGGSDDDEEDEVVAKPSKVKEAAGGTSGGLASSLLEEREEIEVVVRKKKKTKKQKKQKKKKAAESADLFNKAAPGAEYGATGDDDDADYDDI